MRHCTDALRPRVLRCSVVSISIRGNVRERNLLIKRDRREWSDHIFLICAILYPRITLVGVRLGVEPLFGPNPTLKPRAANCLQHVIKQRVVEW